MSHIYVRTVQGMGLPYTPDFNQGNPAGVGYLQMTAGGGRRCSAVDAFLAPLAGNPSLEVVTGASVRRILIENGRAVGVEYEQNGERTTARTDGEVLLSAGAFVSPQLLMLSGIGPAEQLAAFRHRRGGRPPRRRREPAGSRRRADHRRRPRAATATTARTRASA